MELMSSIWKYLLTLFCFLGYVIDNEDFVILDGRDCRMERGRGDQEKLNESAHVITKNAANYANFEVMGRLWVIFTTLLLFIVPSLLGLILGHVCLLFRMDDKISHDDVVNSVIIALFGVAVFIGLPLHIITLGDLEDALDEAEEIFMRKNSGTQTGDDGVQEANHSNA